MGEVPIEIPLVITFDSCRIVAIMMHSVFKSLINSLLVRNQIRRLEIQDSRALSADYADTAIRLVQ